MDDRKAFSKVMQQVKSRPKTQLEMGLMMTEMLRSGSRREGRQD